MYGELTNEEIDSLLARNRYGRLGFNFEGQIHITPINYAYEAGVLYGHAPDGTKVRAMRASPNVAFEVDEIMSAAHWRSVLLHGRYQEVRDPEKKRGAFQSIVDQAGGGERSEVSWALGLNDLVIFRIEIESRTGRFEQREAYSIRPARQGPLPPKSVPAAKGAEAERN
jgi:uncharacterized protein